MATTSTELQPIKQIMQSMDFQIIASKQRSDMTRNTRIQRPRAEEQPFVGLAYTYMYTVVQ